MTTEKGYTATVNVSGLWKPSIVPGDPGKDAFGEIETPTNVTGAITNTTVGGRPVTLNWGWAPFRYAQYWRVPERLLAGLCPTCNPKKTYLVADLAFADDWNMVGTGARSSDLPGDATSPPFQFAVPSAGLLVGDFEDVVDEEVQIPEAEQAALKALIAAPPDLVRLSFSDTLLEDGITQGGSCVDVYGLGSLEAIADGSTGRMLTGKEVRRTGITCKFE